MGQAARTMRHGAGLMRRGRVLVRARQAVAMLVRICRVVGDGRVVMDIVVRLGQLVAIAVLVIAMLVMPWMLVMRRLLVVLIQGALLEVHLRGMVRAMIRFGSVGRVLVRRAGLGFGGAVVVVRELAVPCDVESGTHLHAQHPHQHRDHGEGRVS